MEGGPVEIDLKKTVPSFAVRRGCFDLNDVPPMRYLAADAKAAREAVAGKLTVEFFTCGVF